MNLDTCYIVRRFTYVPYGCIVDEVAHFPEGSENLAIEKWEELIDTLPLNPEVPSEDIEDTRFILSLCLETDEHQDHVTLRRLRGTDKHNINGGI